MVEKEKVSGYKNKYKVGSTIPIQSPIKKQTTTRYSVDEGFQFSFEPIEGSLTIKKTLTGFEARYLVQDNDAESPDSFGDDSLFLVHYHRDFEVKRDNIITKDDARELYQTGKISQQKDYWIFKVDAYIHSGVSLRFGGGFHGLLPQGHEQFDVSSVGLILASKKEFKSEATAEKAAKSLLETWNQSLSGDVYGLVFEKYDKNKNQIKDEETWGYFGYKNALQELKTFNGWKKWFKKRK